MPTGLDGPLEEPKIQWSCANYFYPGRYCICRQSDILSHVTGGVNLEVMYYGCQVDRMLGKEWKQGWRQKDPHRLTVETSPLAGRKIVEIEISI